MFSFQTVCIFFSESELWCKCILLGRYLVHISALRHCAFQSHLQFLECLWANADRLLKHPVTSIMVFGMWCHLLGSCEGFSGTCCFHLQGTKWRQLVAPKCCHLLNYMVLFQQSVILILTAVRTSCHLVSLPSVLCTYAWVISLCINIWKWHNHVWLIMTMTAVKYWILRNKYVGDYILLLIMMSTVTLMMTRTGVS